METSLCLMKDVLKAFYEFEKSLVQVHSMTMNEAILLCILGEKESDCKVHLSASDISEITGFSPSHTSKVLRSAESKKWITRTVCDRDKRKMFFSLSEEGLKKYRQLKSVPVQIPDMLNKLL
ncbi:MAG TPA: winged helix DNA-binding protein [Bacteroidales bacterium]|nr:winged helix DNA-binding protein [Bacteroidales bacterium]HRW94465.1 winged helix DNA-binding protein [Bacteroidales bacterium]